MKLLKHFDVQNSTFTIWELRDAEWDLFAKKLPKEFKCCYITDKDLELRIKNFKSSKAKEFAEILPSVGSIKSGDFGEMLAFFLFKEKLKKYKLDGPKKWQWKQEKNVAAPYTDVILFAVKEFSKPSINDRIVAVESKMKATSAKDYHPIQNAIEGAEKDYISRIANSLSWLRKKFKDESLKVDAPVAKLRRRIQIIERFLHAETLGRYKKELKAVAFLDKRLVAAETSKTITLPTANGIKLQTIVVSIKDLKLMYEQIYNEIPKI